LVGLVTNYAQHFAQEGAATSAFAKATLLLLNLFKFVMNTTTRSARRFRSG
jgi:hypothetical protein